jgi:hypothetical protein
MQPTSFQVASRANQTDFKRLLRVTIVLGLLVTLIGIAALGTKAGSVAANETINPHSSSIEFSNGMPLP